MLEIVHVAKLLVKYIPFILCFLSFITWLYCVFSEKASTSEDEKAEWIVKGNFFVKQGLFMALVALAVNSVIKL